LYQVLKEQVQVQVPKVQVKVQVPVVQYLGCKYKYKYFSRKYKHKYQYLPSSTSTSTSTSVASTSTSTSWRPGKEYNIFGSGINCIGVIGTADGLCPATRCFHQWRPLESQMSVNNGTYRVTHTAQINSSSIRHN